MKFGHLFNVLSVTEHANLHLRARDVRELHGATETLVLLGIVVLQTDLKLHGLRELAILLLRVGQNLGDHLPKRLALKLTVHNNKMNN